MKIATKKGVSGEILSGLVAGKPAIPREPDGGRRRRANGFSAAAASGDKSIRILSGPAAKDMEGPVITNQGGSRMATYNVGYFIGSLAKASINRKLSKALINLAPPELDMTEVPIRDLPLYSYDYDADYPPPARAFKQAIAEVDAVLFITPEYNRSIPGALKNAIDWASRPWGKNSFTRKPSAIIGTSPGAIGTAVAQQSLRSVLCFCNSPLMNTVEAYIRFTPDLITDAGQVTNDATEEFLRNYMAEFLAFIRRVKAAYSSPE